jgi:hypothetical protein
MYEGVHYPDFEYEGAGNLRVNSQGQFACGAFPFKHL